MKRTLIGISFTAVLCVMAVITQAIDITGFGTASVTMDALSITGDLATGNDLSVTRDCSVGRNETVTGTLGVTGAFTGTSGAFSTTLAATGVSTLGNIVYLGAVPKSTFTAAGIAQLQSAVIAGAATVGTTMEVTGNTSLTGDLYVAPGTVYTSTIAAASGNAAIAGTLDVKGDTHLAAGTLYTSTFTVADGKWTAVGFVGPLTGAVTGAASSNALKAGDTMTGQLVLYARNIGQAVALAPAAVGASIYCSDCVPPKVLIGTGTSAGNWADAVGAEFK